MGLAGLGSRGSPDVVGRELVVVHEDSGQGVVHGDRLGLLYDYHVLRVLQVLLREVHFLHVFHRGRESWESY